MKEWLNFRRLKEDLRYFYFYAWHQQRLHFIVQLSNFYNRQLRHYYRSSKSRFLCILMKTGSNPNKNKQKNPTLRTSQIQVHTVQFPPPTPNNMARSQKVFVLKLHIHKMELSPGSLGSNSKAIKILHKPQTSALRLC